MDILTLFQIENVALLLFLLHFYDLPHVQFLEVFSKLSKQTKTQWHIRGHTLHAWAIGNCVHTFQPSMGFHSYIIIMSFLVTFVSGYITREGSNDVNVMSYCDIAK